MVNQERPFGSTTHRERSARAKSKPALPAHDNSNQAHATYGPDWRATMNSHVWAINGRKKGEKQGFKVTRTVPAA